MKLPADLLRLFRELPADEPQLVLRALADLDGNLGETWLATDGQRLGIFSRPPGARWQQASSPLAALRRLEQRDDSPFVWLDFSTAERSYSLKFAGLDQPDLAALTELWRQLAPPSAVPTLAPPGDEPNDDTAEAPELAPLTAFCAAVYAIASVDGVMDELEMHHLQRIVDNRKTVDLGIAWVRREGVPALLTALPRLLNRDQRLCLMANLIEVAMLDLLLRSRELDLLDRFREALQIDAGDYAAINEILTLKNNLAIFPGA